MPIESKSSRIAWSQGYQAADRQSNLLDVEDSFQSMIGGGRFHYNGHGMGMEINAPLSHHETEILYLPERFLRWRCISFKNMPSR